MKVVKVFTNAFNANVAKGLLESEGIQAFVLNENMNMIAGVANRDLLGIELAVADEDYSMACKLLDASSNAE